MNHLKLTSERLLRTAVVYVRQSTPTRVTHNLESQRRQYGLEDRARELGFQRIGVIDEELGRTGATRPAVLTAKIWTSRAAWVSAPGGASLRWRSWRCFLHRGFPPSP
jgi:hypothetical protein